MENCLSSFLGVVGARGSVDLALRLSCELKVVGALELYSMEL